LMRPSQAPFCCAEPFYPPTVGWTSLTRFLPARYRRPWPTNSAHGSCIGYERRAALAQSTSFTG